MNLEVIKSYVAKQCLRLIKSDLTSMIQKIKQKIGLDWIRNSRLLRKEVGQSKEKCRFPIQQPVGTARQGTVWDAGEEGVQVDHAGSPMCCTNLPVRCAQRTDRQCTWVRLPGTCIPGAGSIQEITRRRRMVNHLWPNTKKTGILELVQILKPE